MGIKQNVTREHICISKSFSLNKISYIISFDSSIHFDNLLFLNRFSSDVITIASNEQGLTSHS